MCAKDCNLPTMVGEAGLRVCWQQRLLNVEIDLFRNLPERNLGWHYESPKVLDEDDPVAHCHDRHILSTGGNMNLE